MVKTKHNNIQRKLVFPIYEELSVGEAGEDDEECESGAGLDDKGGCPCDRLLKLGASIGGAGRGGWGGW